MVTRSLVSRFVQLIDPPYHIVDGNGPYTQVNSMDIITSKDTATVEFACNWITEDNLMEFVTYQYGGHTSLCSMHYCAMLLM
jgi:hypothetical protein